MLLPRLGRPSPGGSAFVRPPMRRRRIVIALVAGLLAVATPAALAHTMGSATARAAVSPGVNTAQHPVAHGMVLNNITTPIAVVAADIPRMALDGVNTLTIYVYEFVDGPTSTSLHPGLMTPSDTELQAVIALAHASGMDVTLSPLPWKENPYIWRGTFQPSDVGAFFDSWRTVVNHYADLAQANGVTMLAIGSEQNTLQQYKDQWEETAAQARQHFSGLLTYLSTIDDAVFKIPFWDAVDVVSVSPYLPVSGEAVPTYDEMRAAWLKNNIPYLQRLHDQTQKPVFLAETGYVSAQYLGVHPYEPHPSSVPAAQAQADAYRALLDAFDTANPSWLYGIQWFSWDIPRASILDTSFTPRDKPAECVLAQHWGSGLVQTVANLLPCGSGTSG